MIKHKKQDRWPRDHGRGDKAHDTPDHVAVSRPKSRFEHTDDVAKDRMRNIVSEPLDWACAGRILPERNMRSHFVIIDGIFRKDSAKVIRVERATTVRLG